MSRSLLPAVPVALCLALLGAPAGAGAETFCVHGAQGCVGTAAPTVQAALDVAAIATGRDRVEVGAGVYSEGFRIAAGNPVDVVGVKLPRLALAGAATVVVQEPAAVVSGISMGPVGPTVGPPIDLVAGTLQDAVVEPVLAAPTIRLGAGTLRKVRSPSGFPGGLGVEAVGPGGLIESSRLFGPTGLVSSSNALVVRNSIIEGGGVEVGDAAVRVTGGSVALDDVVVAMFGQAPGTFGLDVAPGAGTASVTLRSVTVRGGFDPLLSTGVRADCSGGGTAAVSLLDTVVVASAVDLQRTGPGCTVDLDHVRYGTRDAGGGAFGDGPGVTSGPVGPFGLLVAPRVASPLIDAGSARPVDAGEHDYFGQARMADGDGDGVAARDLGAVEYQRRPPVAVLAGDERAYLGRDAWVDGYESRDPDAGDSGLLTYAWTSTAHPPTGIRNSAMACCACGSPRSALTVWA